MTDPDELGMLLVGSAEDVPRDWRTTEIEDDEDPDDEDTPCPASVKLILGFDPHELEQESARPRPA